MAVAPERVTSVTEYDAVVPGSAVYAGYWVGSVKRFVEREGAALSARPVRLFSSGPIGTPPKPEEEPSDVAPMRAATGARGHRISIGFVDRGRLGLGKKAILALGSVVVVEAVAMALVLVAMVVVEGLATGAWAVPGMLVLGSVAAISAAIGVRLFGGIEPGPKTTPRGAGAVTTAQA